MKIKLTLMLTFAFVLCSLLLPLGACKIVLGGDGNVTLTNPDNSTFYYDDSNITTYDYVGNAPDGWWMFIGEVTDEDSYWVLGVVIGVLAVGLAVALVMVTRRKEN